MGRSEPLESENTALDERHTRFNATSARSHSTFGLTTTLWNAVNMASLLVNAGFYVMTQVDGQARPVPDTGERRWPL